MVDLAATGAGKNMLEKLVAKRLGWPEEHWYTLIHCKLTGKALKVFNSLSEENFSFETVRNAVLKAYELVPEAYRQKFRDLSRYGNQSFVEFAREKTELMNKWLEASGTKSAEEIKELFLLEDFKESLSKEEADTIKTQLEEAGAKVSIN